MNPMYHGGRIELKVDEVKRILQEQSLKRWWVAEFSGVHKTTLRRWLKRQIHHVSTHRAAALAKVLGVELQQIVARQS
jgi:hypothetical protein